MRLSRLLLPVLAIALLSQSAFAWNDLGHKTVALIAWDNLKPEAKTKITALLAKHPQFDSILHTKGANDAETQTLTFMTGAVWPDIVKGGDPKNRQYNHPVWHYTDIPFITGTLPEGSKPATLGTDYTPGTEPDNILPALKKCVADIQDPNATDAQKAIALAWMEHLIGDIHQPLHATSWFSAEFPEGDQGGNFCLINDGASMSKLHAYWDGILGGYQSMEITRHIADGIEKEHPKSEFEKQLKVTNFNDWAQESYGICKSVVYLDGKIPHTTKAAQAANKMNPIPVLPKDYAANAKAAGKKQIALAGYRLADQLNTLFSDK